MDAVIVLARLAQYGAAAVAFGTPLFMLYALRPADRATQRWPHPLTVLANMTLLGGPLALFLAQTAVMAGDPAAAFDPEMLGAALGGTPFGLAMVARGMAAAGTLALGFTMRPGKRLWLGLSVLGGVAVASFAWTGHGAATEGPEGLLHLVADVLHLLAAGVWLGALVALALMLRSAVRGRRQASAVRALHAGLAGFSGVGAAAVATLILTGLVNSWFLIGPSGVERVTTSAYGLLLLAKVAAFTGMLALAAANRFVLTPRLAAALVSDDPARALPALRRSLLLETAAAGLVFALVAMLGILAPPSAG